MEILEVIVEAWGWKGIKPAAIIDTNPFGNVLVTDVSGSVWRICPEELRATQFADGDFDRIRQSVEFAEDWNMTELVQRAQDLLGDPGEDRCYCLKVPGVLGGKYDDSNLATISFSELLLVSGALARQIEGLPDGSDVRLVVK